MILTWECWCRHQQGCKGGCKWVTVAVCAGSGQDHNNQNSHDIITTSNLPKSITISPVNSCVRFWGGLIVYSWKIADDDDDDGDYDEGDYDEGDDDDDNDDDSDHTKVMRPTDGEVSFNRAAHHEEDGTAQGDPGWNSQCDRQLWIVNWHFEIWHWPLVHTFPPSQSNL